MNPYLQSIQAYIFLRTIYLAFTETSRSTSELVEQMARSNDPQEISALMVAALSAATSAQEQQQLLVELTRKVEERKLHLAEAARQEAGLARRHSADGSGVDAFIRGSDSKAVSIEDSSGGLIAEMVSSSSLSSFDASAAARNYGQGSISLVPSDVQNVPDQNSSSSSSFSSDTVSSASHSSCLLPDLASEGGSCSKAVVVELSPPTASSSTSPAATIQGPPSESKDVGSIKFSFTKSRAKPQHILSKSTAEVFAETAELKPKLPMLYEETAQKGSSVSESSDNTGCIPGVLKALMKDVMGITQCTASEKQLMNLLKTDTETAQKTAKETTKRGEEKATDRQLLDVLPETQKLKNEDAKKLFGDVKKPKLSVNIDSAAATSAIATSGSGGPKQDSAAGKPVQTDTPPSIDELLDKLKKEGFQFKQTDGTSAPALCSLGASKQSSSSAPIDSQFSKNAAHASFFDPQTSSYLTTSSSASSTMPGQSFGPWLKKDSSPSQLTSLTSSEFGSAAKTAGPTVAKRTSFGDYHECLPSAIQNLESQVVGPPAYTAAQTNPPDPVAFPQLPTDSYNYPLPPLPATLPPLPPASHGPPNPLDPLAFPQLPTDSYNYPPPPPPSTLPPLPPPSQGPPNPQFAPPPLEPHALFQPTLRAGPQALPRLPKDLSQPHPAGTEPTAPGTVSEDFPPSDVDLPPLPPEQSPPPPPTPPSPSFPAALDGQFSHSAPADLEYRHKDSHHSHHGYPQHRSGGNRSFYRH